MTEAAEDAVEETTAAAEEVVEEATETAEDAVEEVVDAPELSLDQIFSGDDFDLTAATEALAASSLDDQTKATLTTALERAEGSDTLLPIVLDRVRSALGL